MTSSPRTSRSGYQNEHGDDVRSGILRYTWTGCTLAPSSAQRLEFHTWTSTSVVHSWRRFLGWKLDIGVPGCLGMEERPVYINEAYFHL